MSEPKYATNADLVIAVVGIWLFLLLTFAWGRYDAAGSRSLERRITALEQKK